MTRLLAALLASALLAGCAPTTPDPDPAPAAPPAPETTTTASPTATTTDPPSLRDRTLLGAYYYLWNPENLAQGWLRNRLAPPQRDMQTQAEAPDGGAADDIRQAADAGIDFFAVNWWPTRPEQNRRLDERLLRAPNIGDIRFCLFYETQDLNFDPRDGTTLLGPRQVERFVADVEDLATRYFDHPGYLRVDGRPVLILYLTRTLVGDVAGAVTRAREALRAKGHDVLLIGDEVFWNAARHGPRRGPTVRTPQSERAGLFDGLTAYNLYDAGRRADTGHGATSSFLAESRALYERYEEATGGRIPIVPGVIPGFNDRGARSRLARPVIPRQWAPGEPEGSFLAHAVDDLALPLVDERLPMVLVTSWNEWNEDTAVEPVAPAPPTTTDDSPSGRGFTAGHPYGGHGTAYVDVLRDRFAPPAAG
ncbi:MAG TPA: glycoside hydrolase family 99-like domain-containing protein [Acidimicrobiales bacterium]|nr:glycoside hydrolase family 99-like domain-containing protein [Acidimicrobiales bacterium]